MKKWPWVITILYGIIIIIFTWPVAYIAFYSPKEASSEIHIFGNLVYWAWLLVMVLGQVALLVIPVNVATRRPVTKRAIIYPVIFSGLMMAGLAVGVVWSIAETVMQENAIGGHLWWIALLVLLLMWALWGYIFFKWSKHSEPRNFIEKICRALFKGSILELLIAVPTHVVARYRDYCCAGAMTFLGIGIGGAVMLFSFGPGVFFLFIERWNRLHPK